MTIVISSDIFEPDPNDSFPVNNVNVVLLRDVNYTITNDTAIGFEFLDPDLTLTIMGNVFAAAGNIVRASSNGEIVITDTGVLVGEGLGVFLDGSDNLVMNGGYISAGGNGISASSNEQTIINTGTLLADILGITLGGMGHTVNNSGFLYAKSTAVQLSSSQAVSSVVNNTGQIVSDNQGIAFFGDGVSVANSGLIQAAGNAIFTNTGASSATITNTGSIQSGGFAVSIGGGQSSVTNDGDISAQNDAVRVGSGGNVVGNAVLNTGTLTSEGGAAIRSQGYFATVTNSGDLTGQNGGIFAASRNASETDAGNNQVTNALGGTVTSGGTGIQVQGSGNVVLNEGAVNAATSAVLLSGTGSITNTGTLVGDDWGINALATTNLTTGSDIVNTGTITANEGVRVVYGSSAAATRIINEGTVTGTNSYGVDANASLILRNSGSITGQIDALRLSFGTDHRVYNFGTMEGGMQVTGLGDHYVRNFGTIIDAEGTAVTMLTDGGELLLMNAGTISGVGTTVAVGEGPITLINRGTIDTENSGGGFGGQRIALEAGRLSDTITNYGVITGNVILGAGGDSYIAYGSGEAGGVFAGAGDDFLQGAALLDFFEGGEGGDSILGRGGDDLLYAGAGNDAVKGGQGDDLIFGEAGDDELSGGSGDDRVLGNNGNDTINGDAGDDRLEGGNGDDVIFGGSGDDTLDGEGGVDTLVGGSGDDTLNGGGGTDILDGGRGNDVLDVGAGGRDIMVFDLGDGIDTVFQFEAARDQIDLRSLGLGGLGDLGGVATITDSGAGAQVVFDTGDRIVLLGVASADLTADAFIF
ncbi:MAG: calcium-binding protein [Pseudomonadota bacterium]